MYWMRFWGFGQIYFCKTLIIIWYLVVSKTSVIGSLVKAYVWRIRKYDENIALYQYCRGYIYEIGVMLFKNYNL